jgi:hypothetical protein
MNQHEYVKAVYDSELNRTCVDILIFFAWRKNWKNDTLVWGSAENIGKTIRVGARDVENWTPFLREMGWLVDTGERAQGNGRPLIKYDLAIGTFTDATSDKAKRRRKTKDFPDATSVNSTEDSDSEPTLSRRDVTETGDFPAVTADFPDVTTEEQGINKIKEEQVSTTTPAAPVETSKEFSIREDEVFDSSTLSNQVLEAKPSMAPKEPVLPKKRIDNYHDIVNEFITVSSLMRDLPNEVRDDARALALDIDFKPEVSRPSIRINDAIAKAWMDYEARGGN